MKATVNRFLSMQKALIQRRQQLEQVKNSATQRTRYFDAGHETRVEEPTYDIKTVDKMITRINRAMFEIDSMIKQSNASVELDINVDFDELMKELA